MVDLILAEYRWHERDHELAVRAERERQIREGRQPAQTIAHSLRALSGEALIALGYWLKPHDARFTSRVMTTWAATPPSGDTDRATPYTFIYYSQLMPAGAGRGSGLMLFTVTWLPIQSLPARS